MLLTLAILCGFALDLLFGDPAIPHIPHPVVVMGRIITRLETRLRRVFPGTPEGEKAAGRVLAVSLPLGTLAVTVLACRGGAALYPAIRFILETLWCWQALAIKGLASESWNVYRVLRTGNLPAARKAVGRIVGRDTQTLTGEGIIKATVETVAENFSDGVASPLFYMLIGGAPLAMTYKAINTMDSMVGYKNERYFYFGRAAARLDDAANFLPSRIAALFWIAASGPAGQDAGRVWRRDRRRHASPNSAQCEAACAGALGVQLAGPASYFGKVYENPPSGMTCGPWSRKTFCGQTECCIQRVFWLWRRGLPCGFCWRECYGADTWRGLGRLYVAAWANTAGFLRQRQPAGRPRRRAPGHRALSGGLGPLPGPALPGIAGENRRKREYAC